MSLISVNNLTFAYEVKHTDYLTINIIREIASNVEDWKISKELSLLDAENDIMSSNKV